MFSSETVSYIEQAVEGMKLVCHELSQAANDAESAVMDDLVKDSDRLVSCLTGKVKLPNLFIGCITCVRWLYSVM